MITDTWFLMFIKHLNMIYSQMGRTWMFINLDDNTELTVLAIQVMLMLRSLMFITPLSGTLVYLRVTILVNVIFTLLMLIEVF